MSQPADAPPTEAKRGRGRPKGGRRTIPERQIVEALTQARGNHYKASELLGCSHQNVSSRIARSDRLRQLCVELEEENLDRAEWKVQEHIDKDNVTALAMYLNNKGRHRGWGRQNFEINGRMDHDHRHAHLHAHTQLAQLGVDLDQYSDEQLRAMRDAAAAMMNGQDRDFGKALLPGARLETEPEG